MRTLASALTARLTKSINHPAVTVTIDDRHAGVHRPRWATFLADSVPDGPSTIFMAYDGALVRARVNPTTHTLHIQRITDPTSASQWAQWAQLATGVATSQIAAAWDGNSRQYLFWATATAIRGSYTDNNGATWSSASTVATLAAGTTCTGICASLNSGEGICYLYYAQQTATTATIYQMTHPETSGVWSSPVACSGWQIEPLPPKPKQPPIIPPPTRGLAIHGVGETLRIILCHNNGVYAYTAPAASPTVWTLTTTILPSDDPTRYYSYPYIALSFDYMYALFFTHTNSADDVTTLHHILSPDWSTWTATPRPYQMTAAYGACSVGTLTHHHLCTSRYVYRATRWDEDDPTKRIDVSTDLLALTFTERMNAAGEMKLTLRNDDGRYATDLPGSSNYQAIRRGSQITPWLGYTISGAALTSAYRSWWITDITHNRQRRRSHLVITATDGWGLLYKDNAHRAYTWTNKTITQLLTLILGGYGFDVTTDSNAAWDTVLPTFTIPPETPLGRPVLHLLTLAGGQLIFRTDATWEHHWPSAVAHLLIPTLTSAYTIGAAHPITSGSYSTHHQAHNVVRATNTQTNRTAYDWQAIENDNQARHDARLDVRLDATGLTALATNSIADEQRTTDDATVTMPPHPGLEIADTVTIEDDVITLNAAYIIEANTIEYDAMKAVYDHTLTLGHNT